MAIYSGKMSNFAANKQMALWRQEIRDDALTHVGGFVLTEFVFHCFFLRKVTPVVWIVKIFRHPLTFYRVCLDLACLWVILKNVTSLCFFLHICNLSAKNEYICSPIMGKKESKLGEK